MNIKTWVSIPFYSQNNFQRHHVRCLQNLPIFSNLYTKIPRDPDTSRETSENIPMFTNKVHLIAPCAKQNTLISWNSS
jgi:hypothetical protein